MGATLITIAEVSERVSLSRSEIYRRMKLRVFPQRVKIGPKRIAFVEHEVEAWLNARIEERVNHG